MSYLVENVTTGQVYFPSTITSTVRLRYPSIHTLLSGWGNVLHTKLLSTCFIVCHLVGGQLFIQPLCRNSVMANIAQFLVCEKNQMYLIVG